MIVFVHAGNAPLPDYMGDSLAIASRVAPKSEIVLLANACHQPAFTAIAGRARFVAIESIPPSEVTLQFRARSALNRDFRDGFWFFATERFLILADYIRHSGAEDVVHLENDVVLYFDPADRLDAFRGFADFAVPLDRVRAIAGIVWCVNHRASDRLAAYLLSQPDRNDMESVGSFCLANPDIARPLPTLPPAYAAAKGLDPQRYCQGVDAFGGIFDAAAIGQYVGGVHWLNNPHDSRFFINESSDLDLREFDFSWAVRNGVRQPWLAYAGERLPALCLHAHSKDLAGVSPFNHGVAHETGDLVTAAAIAARAGRSLQLGPAATGGNGLPVATNEAGQILVPDKAFVDACNAAGSIALPSALVQYFKLYVAPRLSRPFSMLALGGEPPLGLNELGLLNHAKLMRCWAQNAVIAHERLQALPMGVADDPAAVAELLAAANAVVKDAVLYVAGEPAQAGPAHAMAVAAGLPLATVSPAVDRAERLRQLARHKFCTCFGGGRDVHEFWEAQYLDCIPVLLASEWNPAFAELPLILLNTWDDLRHVDWLREYVRIRSTAFRYEKLSLTSIAHRIGAGAVELTPSEASPP